MSFRETWVDPKSGSEIERSLFEKKPTWYRAYQHRIYIVCDLHGRMGGTRHMKVGPRDWSKHEPLTKREILAWFKTSAPTWEMRVDLPVPLQEREVVCVSASQLTERAGEWKALRDLGEEDL